MGNEGPFPGGKVAILVVTTHKWSLTDAVLLRGVMEQQLKGSTAGSLENWSQGAMKDPY
jgi:hypothetical protein